MPLLKTPPPRDPHGSWASLRRALVLASSLLLAGAPASSAPGSAPEYQVKALFLFNFVSFVEWPPAAFAGPDSPVVIGILGDDVFGPYLADALSAGQAKGRPLVVQRYQRVEEIKTCHILFVSPSESDRLPAILAVLGSRSILTVGETPNFTRRGGMIRFVIENNKIRLRVNLAAARAAGLTLSSKLLRLAEIVKS